jgi:hypothetical protein
LFIFHQVKHTVLVLIKRIGEIIKYIPNEDYIIMGKMFSLIGARSLISASSSFE